MSSSYNVRNYKTRDEEEILPLLVTAFPEWEKRKNALDFWKWKYMDTPYGSDLKIIEKEGHIIFIGHEILEYITIGDATILARYGDDYVTHPDYRGQGLWAATRGYAEEMEKRLGIKYSFAISTNPIVIDSNKKRGNKGFPREIIHMARIPDMDQYLKLKKIKNPHLVKGGYLIKKALNTVSSLNTSDKDSKKSITIKETNNLDKKMDDLWEKIKGDYKFIIDKSSKFLNWRYCDPRAGKYRIFQALSNDIIQGFIVIGVKEEPDYKEGYVMDLLTLQDKDYLADRLIKSAITVLEEEKVIAVHYKTVSGGRHQQAFARHDFLEVPSMGVFVTSSFKGDMQLEPIFRNAPPQQLHFGYGDYY